MKSTVILGISIVAALLLVAGAFVFLKPVEEVKLPVVVEEYLDFNCSHCIEFYPTIEQLRADYNSNPDVKFEIIMTPILGNSSLQAAFAAEAAREQGKYVEFTDILFKNGNNRSDEDYAKFAQQLGMDVEKFNKDKESEEIQKRVNDQVEKNKADGVTSTPTLIINGRRVSDRSYENIKKLIEEKVTLGREQASKESE